MRILWTVNTLFPEVGEKFGIKSTHSISWVEAMSKELVKCNDIQLAIACSCNVKTLITENYNGIIYYIVPNHDEKRNWSIVLNNFNPDIIHAYGTEKKHNLIISQLNNNIPILISLQGLLSEYEKNYYAGIDISKILRYTPIRDIIRPSGFISGRKDFIRRSKIEKRILRNVKNVEGRSTWDRVSARNINPDLNYYFCPRMLREPFYTSEKWNINAIQRHTIFVAQGNYPIKGLHFAIQAVAKLKRIYPDIKLIIAEKNFLDEVKGIKRIKTTGYKRYLFDMVKKLDVKGNLEFIGNQDAYGMTKKIKECHVALIPSSIENAPNSLAEAMILGTPCVASFVGGNMDMLVHNEEGFLYTYNEPNMLAEYIDNIFSSDELACKLSKNEIKKAEKRHNREKLVETLINIYEKIIDTEK